MRVLLLTTWYPTASSPGSGVFVAKDAELLATRHDVRVVHLAPPDQLSDEDAINDRASDISVTRIRMSTRSARDVLRARRALRGHLREWADVLHTQAFSTLLPLAGPRPRLPWVHTEHWSALSTPSTIGYARHALPALKPLLRQPDVVTTVCDYLARPVREHRRGPTRIVPCLVPPVQELAPYPGGDVYRLVSVGGLIGRKDPLTAVRALKLIHDAGVPATLRFVGDGPLRSSILRLAAELGLSPFVTLAGLLDAAGVAREIDAADAFLLPTLGENFCVSAAEAITRGRPVVVGANGGQGEYITPQNGETVAAQTPQAYADAVLRVIRREPRPTPTEVAATIGDRFSAQRVLGGYESAYEEARSLGA